MNKFLAIFKAENILNSLKNIFSRFPVSALISIIATIVLVFLYQKRIIENYGIDLNIFGSIGVSLVITFFLSVGTYIFGESFNFSKKKNQLFQLFPIIYGIIFYLYLYTNIDSFSSFVFTALNVVFIFSLIFFAPFIKKIFCKELDENPKNQENFYAYFSSILFTILFSFIVSFSFFALSSLGIFTVETLFEFKRLSNKIPYIFIFSSCFLAPFIALNNIPQKETFENGRFNENNFSLFLIKYLAIPFIFIYFIILYTYSVRVLINFSDWPKGEVSWLVIIFSIFGYFTYLISYMYEEKISSVKKFRKIFPFIVIPQVFMLFYAIYLRIEQYGLTTNRYFVVIFGIWLLCISVYYIFSKRKYLAYTFVLLFLFSSIISIGPWSVLNLPEILQTNLLKKDLKEIGILKKSGEIIPLKDTDLKEENYDFRGKISRKIDYLCDYHNCEKLILTFVKDVKKLEFKNSIKVIDGKEIFEKAEKREDLKKFSKWELKGALKNYFNINIDYYYYDNKSNNDIKKISGDFYDNEIFYEVKGFDYFSEYSNQINEDYIKKDKKSISIADLEKKEIKIFKNGEILGRINLSEILEKIIKENSKDKNNRIDKKPIFEIENEKIKAKLIIRDLRLYIKDGKIYDSQGNYRFESNINGVIVFSKK